ncbi:MAG: rod shape-determining protein RodA [Chlorobi bacterium]|nr:MAG: rod shape-determining protein RodA [Bacteroidota bacterium]MBE2265874.1 rod shape-determining protein RodA [Flavobacteriales bacterium]MBL1160098.1 rod shape-determining protein RodA [Chlorobiota bacterium]MBW7854194.1 rod shape-determining protein RodA [Candidatus Kapabacteria bacterium]MCC6330592.1 rod shape-determining protein RodA [Ignavibacteria bacterium]
MPTPYLYEGNDDGLQRTVSDMIDWGLFLAVIAVLGLGLISIYSSVFTSDPGIFRNQVIYAFVGLASGTIAFFIRERWIKGLAFPIYILSVLLLIAVLTPLGHEVNGQRCWIKLGSFTFQPSEFAKVATIFAMARVATRKGFSISTLRDFATIVSLILPPLALIMLQPDTGSATVFFAILMGVLLWVGADLFILYVLTCIPFIGVAALYSTLFDNIWWFAGIAAAVCGGVFFFRKGVIPKVIAILLLIGIGLSVEPVFDKLETYQQNRLITLFEPERNPRGEGYHVIQSMLAVGSGGLSGKGFLKGTQTQLRYIPEQWTDFIFCVPTEEFGFIGGVLVIALLASIILRSFNIAGSVRTQFASVIAVGFGTMLLYHTLINIGMAIGIVPVMGIPLPFLSAGGTSLIINLTVVGLLMNFYKTRKRRRAGAAA